MSEQDERLLGLDEAAERLGVCKRTVQRLIAGGELPEPVKVGRRSLLLASDIQAFLQRLIGARKGMVAS
jgi:excisionase family DNA binding protein